MSEHEAPGSDLAPNCRCLPAPTPREKFDDGQVPVYFIGGQHCGDMACGWEHERITVPSKSVAQRLHVYQRTGRVLPTEPPARVYHHVGILDGVA